MKAILMLAVSAALLSACATGPQTAWGKPGISKVDYVTDLGTCTARSALAEAGNGANTAGGLSGKNGSAPPPTGADAAKTGGQNGGPPPGQATPTGGGGVYRDSAPADVVNRAATQQQTQAMAAQRARTEALKSCYTDLGYQEFKLTPEQRQHLGTLKKGTNEYLQYLAEIGTSTAVAASQPAAKTGS
jgi:hypothetical protein